MAAGRAVAALRSARTTATIRRPSRRRSRTPPDGRPYVLVLQLRRDDMPELGFPDGADLFQLLWCPASHADEYAPASSAPAGGPGRGPRAVRRAGAVAGHRRSASTPQVVRARSGTGRRVPERLRPRRGPGRATSGTGRTPFSAEPDYQYRLSVAPGTKVGRIPALVPGSAMADGRRRARDGASAHRLGPRVRRRILVALDPRARRPACGRDRTDARLAVQEAPGLQLGMGSMYVFVCRACDDWPVAQVYQR